MHLDHENNLTCTHSIAECLTAIASEEKLRGADYVRVEWDTESYGSNKYVTSNSSDAIVVAFITHDPFQNGEYMTMPPWYVGRELTRVIGA